MYNIFNMNLVSPERHQQLTERVQVEEKRKNLKTPWGAPVMISYEHIQRHMLGSGVLGASISAWKSPELMLLDEEVWKFVKESVGSIKKNMRPGEAAKFLHQFDFPIGNECICKIENLPKSAKVWHEGRERYIINVTDEPAPETNSLQIMLLRDKKHPSQFLLHSAWAGSVESPSGGLSNPEWDEYVFYSKNR